MNLLPHVSDELLEFGGEQWYPVGDYAFVIQEVYINDLGVQDDGSPYRGYMTSDGEQISLQLGQWEPLNGSAPAPGNNKQFLRICLEDGPKTIGSVDPKDTEYRELAKGLRKIVALARALGETPDMDFVEALKQGSLNGRRVGATFVKWTSKTGRGSYPKKFFSV